MPNKQVFCEVCRRQMRSDHLKRHMSTHENNSPINPISVMKEIPIYNNDNTASDLSIGTMNRIINNDIPTNVQLRSF